MTRRAIAAHQAEVEELARRLARGPQLPMGQASILWAILQQLQGTRGPAPSLAALAEVTGTSRQQALRSLRALQARGVLTTEQHQVVTTSTSSVRQVVVRAPWLDPLIHAPQPAKGRRRTK